MNEPSSSKDVHRSLATSPDEWLEKADQLFEGAQALEPAVRQYWTQPPGQRSASATLMSIYFMLSGFAIENCLKALVLVHQRKVLLTQIDEKGRLPELLRKHDLELLCTQAGIKIHDLETIGLLKRLTRCTTWESRYPVPLDGPALKKNDTYQIEGYITASAYQDTDVDNIINLFNALRTTAGNKANTLKEP